MTLMAVLVLLFGVAAARPSSAPGPSLPVSGCRRSTSSRKWDLAEVPESDCFDVCAQALGRTHIPFSLQTPERSADRQRWIAVGSSFPDNREESTQT